MKSILAGPIYIWTFARAGAEVLSALHRKGRIRPSVLGAAQERFDGRAEELLGRLLGITLAGGSVLEDALELLERRLGDLESPE